MTLTQKVFTLKSIKPFDRLTNSELILIANTIKIKKYLDNTLIHSKENILYNLLIVVDGKVKSKSKKVANYIGLKELLNDDLLSENIYADGEVTVFLLSKAHLLTLLYASPSIMIGFLELKSGNLV